MICEQLQNGTRKCGIELKITYTPKNDKCIFRICNYIIRRLDFRMNCYVSYHVGNQLYQKWHNFSVRFDFTRRTPNDVSKAAHENQESDQMGPNVHGFIVNPKPAET